MLQRSKVVTVTVNTDASFSNEHKVGGWAFTLVSNCFRVKRSGVFHTPPTSIHDAEIKCIGNALHTLLHLKGLPEARWLVINTDSLHAIDAIRRKKEGSGAKVHKLWTKTIHALGSKKNKFRHVKAHNGTPDARSWVNHWCDREAKRHMRAQVAQLTGKTYDTYRGRWVEDPVVGDNIESEVWSDLYNDLHF